MRADEGVDRADPLRDCVVDCAFEDDPVAAEKGRGSPLTPVESGRVRHEDLDHEGPVGAEVVGDCLEAVHLRVLRHEDEEGVEGDEDELKGPLGRYAREVSDGDRDVVASRFGSQLGRHCLRGIDAVDVDAAREEGQRHPSRTDAQLERSSAARQRRKKLRRVLGIRAWRVEHVVDGSDPVAVG